MANYTLNDKGQEVLAIGAPGSIVRVQVEYPSLIEKINSFWFQFAEGNYRQGIPEVIDMIREAGITSHLETESIIKSTYFKDYYTYQYY